jgi:hypothetical protein
VKSLQYDPDKPVPAKRWSELGEDAQINLVKKFHRRAGIDLPNEQIHAVIHVIIENQVLLGDETPVAATLERLMREGLSRHDGIHAIGSVLAPFMMEMMRGDVDSNDVYYDRLAALTAEGWLSEFS